MEEELCSLGINKNDAKIFIAINELGLCTTTEIAKKTKIHRSNVYDGVQSLIDKGLISYILKGTTKYFQSNKPQSILDMLKEKEEIAKAIIPRIELLQNMGNELSQVSMQEGLTAAKRALDGFLDRDNTKILIMGVPSDASKLLGPFLPGFHRRRIEQKIVMKHIYNTDVNERIKILSKMPYTEARVLPSKYDIPLSIIIADDEVVLIKWDKNAVVITLKNESIVEAYTTYFNYMWKDTIDPINGAPIKKWPHIKD